MAFMKLFIRRVPGLHKICLLIPRTCQEKETKIQSFFQDKHAWKFTDCGLGWANDLISLAELFLWGTLSRRQLRPTWLLDPTERAPFPLPVFRLHMRSSITMTCRSDRSLEMVTNTLCAFWSWTCFYCVIIDSSLACILGTVNIHLARMLPIINDWKSLQIRGWKAGDKYTVLRLLIHTIVKIAGCH